MFKTDIFRNVNIVLDHEGRRFGIVEYTQFLDFDFDFASCHFRVDRAFRAGRYDTAHGDDIFTANPFGFGMRFRVAVRVEGQLCYPLAVTQVNKDQTAVITASLNPAHKTDFLADVSGRDAAAEMASFPITQNIDQVRLLGHADKFQ